MIQEDIFFCIEKRKSASATAGVEWVIKARFPVGNYWVIHAFETEPRKDEIDEIITTILRSFEFYHYHLKIPEFKIIKHMEKR